MLQRHGRENATSGRASRITGSITHQPRTKNDLFTLMYSQEKAGRNVYQVRYIELKQADTGCDQSAHVSSDRREILRVSSFHLGIIQFYLSS